MIIILVIEYLQLFLWLQTKKKVGRFISAMVTIMYKDVKGFLVVLAVILLGFAACFIILMERSERMKNWISVSWIMYELSVGTGEYFKDEMDFIVADDSADPYRRPVIILTYIGYITLMLVVIMNLLIAVMSQTADALSSEIHLREQRLKLSSISLTARRLRATRILTCGWCKRIKTVGGESGNSVNLNILDNVNKSKRSIALKKYYMKIHYLCSLEEESIEIDKDGVVHTKHLKSTEEEILDNLRMIEQWIYKSPMHSLKTKKVPANIPQRQPHKHLSQRIQKFG